MYRKYIGYSFMNSLVFQTHVPENLGEWNLKTEEVVGCLEEGCMLVPGCPFSLDPI